jgi:ribose transport system permease protein
LVNVSKQKTQLAERSPSKTAAVTVPGAGTPDQDIVTAAEPAERKNPVRDVLLTLLSKGYLFIVALIVLAVGSQLSPYFLTSRNLVSVLITASVVSVLAVGQFFVIVTGGIDLSVGSVAALSSVVGALAMAHGIPFVLASLLAVAMGGFIGLLNGLFIVFGGITPFIVTLAMMSAAQGLAYVVQGTRLVPIDNTAFLSAFTGDIGPIPAPVFIAAVTMLVAAVVMAFRRFGRQLYALGGNPEAARLSGLPVKRDTAAAYVISGALAGLAGLMIAAQLTEGSAIVGSGYELNAIAAVVVGGASLFGGTGNPILAVLGGLIIATILNIMDILGIPAQSQLIVKGIVILLAVLFTSGTLTRRLPQWFSALGRLASRSTPRRASS